MRECARGHSGQPGTPSWVQSRKPTTPVTWWLLSNRQAWGQPLGPPVPPPPGNSPTPSSCWGHPLSRDYPTAPHNPFPACRKTSLKGKPDHVPALGRGARILTGAEQTLSGLASLLPRSSEGTSLASPTTHTPPTNPAGRSHLLSLPQTRLELGLCSGLLRGEQAWPQRMCPFSGRPRPPSSIGHIYMLVTRARPQASAHSHVS